MISSQHYLVYFVRTMAVLVGTFPTFGFLGDENILIFVLEDLLGELVPTGPRLTTVLLMFICLMIP